jgi:peptidoglycan/LPS O-acetylase OafA/YrhL
MSQRLLLLNGLAIVGAVVHHAMHWVLTGMFWWTDRYRMVSVPNFDQAGGINFWLIRIIDQFAFVGVPVFLFVSGFFIAFTAGRDQKTVEWKIVGTRIKNLIIPYLIWSVLIIAGRLILQGERITVAEFARMLILGQAVAPFYYVPLLVQLYILSPFLIPIARNRWQLLVIGALLLQIPVTISYYVAVLKLDVPVSGDILAIFRSWYLLDLGIWFILGIIVKLHLPAFRAWLVRITPFLLPSLILVFILGIIEWQILRQLSGIEWVAPAITAFDKIFALFLVLYCLSLKKLPLPFSRQLTSIGTKTYGIYLVHIPVLNFTAKVTYHVMPWLLAYPLLFLLTLTIAGLGVPLLLMEGVRRSPARRAYVYLFG